MEPGTLAHLVVLRERDFMTVALQVLTMADPVMGLKLDPGSGEQIEKRHLLHRFAACQQLTTHLARIGCQEPVATLRPNGAVLDVSREARACRARWVGSLPSSSILSLPSVPVRKWSSVFWSLP